jgi:ATP-dependent DNA helicase RecG
MEDRKRKWFYRIQFEELYGIARDLRWSQRECLLPGTAFSRGENLQNEFRKNLTFTLTPEQEQVITKLNALSRSEQKMHVLLQGDVGCGKTVTSFLASLNALESGFQIAWLAPTTVLAEQSYTVIHTWLAGLGYTCSLLTSRTPAREKRQIIHGLLRGSIHYIVGTHSLIEDSLSFAHLGMVVIDEQHRFGTAQRLKLQNKNPRADFLMMSATPIPGSLAQTVYSDLDILTITAVPHERKPVKTHIVPPVKEQDMYRFITDRVLTHGEKIFWVIPRIEEDEENSEIATITKREESLSRLLPELTVYSLHGKMTPEEKSHVMKAFSLDSSGLLLATTVIEVGIDIPDATIMVIENCEFFGLAQLHQLRGRVGRSNRQSWAFLLPGNSAGEKTLERLQQFCSTTDGFKIAEMDLRMRGTGEVLGNRQSGFSDIRFSNILHMAPVFKSIRTTVDELLRET